MGKFTKCPNCVKQLVEVPLKKEGNFMTCPFCESEYPISIPNEIISKLGLRK